MSRVKRLYPLGKYRLRIPKKSERDKKYPVEIEYTWNRQAIRKTMNLFVKISDWNQNLNNGRGGVRSTYGPDAKLINNVILMKVEKIDAMLAEYAAKNPDKVTIDVSVR